MATLIGDRLASDGPSAAARAGMRLWRLFTSVNFAVVQIIMLALLAVVGMTVRQLPGFAFHSAGDYANEMGKLRAVYEPALGAGVVGVMERLQLFRVFTSTWFSLGLVILVVSIVICTLDRTPRLWRQSAVIRVVQPDAYFDPTLPDRVSIQPGSGLTAASVIAVLRRRRFGVREVETETGERFIYGDRNRWTKLATLISHLGLILFLIAGLVTARLGDEQGLVVAEGDTLTVQPIGTPGLLLVKNFGFRAPGLEAGVATDFTTDLAVYRDGALLARKTIRVNDPLSVAGYTFHQNGFGPAPDLEIKDAGDGSVLWSGPVPLTDSDGGLPTGALPVPGRAIGVQLLLAKDAAGVGTLLVVPYAVTGTNPDGITYQWAPAKLAGDGTIDFAGDPLATDVRWRFRQGALSNDKDGGHTVHGVIMDRTSIVLRTDNIVVEALLGQVDALDPYASALQALDLLSREAQKEAREAETRQTTDALDLIAAQADNQKLDAWQKVFPDNPDIEVVPAAVVTENGQGVPAPR